MDIKALIRTIPDYPRPGVQFRDITSLLENARGLHATVQGLARPYRGERIDKVAGIEARGFLFGVAVALELSAGFIPVRKQGKLPGTTVGCDYELEYGMDRVEIHDDALASGDRVLIVDDLIATGGTARATIQLIDHVGAEVVGCCFVVDLPELGGSRKIAADGYPTHSLCSFEGE